MPRALIAALTVCLLAPGAASAAELTADRDCYIDGQPVGISGTGWAPGSSFNVFGDGLSGSGIADDAGTFAFETAAPFVGPRLKPRTIKLTGQQDGTEVATTSIRVVDFLVSPRDPSGKPTGKTSWGFSGFAPGKPIFFHVQRGRKTYTDKVGRGDKPCGTLRTRLRRLPAVPPSKVTFGKYKVFVDNRRKLVKRGLQYRATITIYRTAT